MTYPISLGPELDAFIASRVASGEGDAEDVIRTALNQYRRELAAQEQLRAALEAGEASGIFEGDPFESVAAELGLEMIRCGR
jgi:putative addiction module CopG family antidote